MLYNAHERTINAPPDEVGALLDTLGGDDDRLWPAPPWAPLLLDRPLGVGARGGHGSVRYEVTEYEPGRRIRYRFRRTTGIDGVHEFSVQPLADGRCRMRHLLIGRPRRIMRILVPLVIERLHDALLEDLLDNLEREATGTVTRKTRWSPWVRIWWRLLADSEIRTGEKATERDTARR